MITLYKTIKERFIKLDETKIEDLSLDTFDTTTVEVSNLDTRTTEEELMNHFSEFENIISSIIILRDGNGESTGKAHVDFLEY